MEASVVNTPFNETQIFLLQVFAQIKSDEEKTDIQAMLLDYYRKRVDFHANEISLSNEKIEEILNSHYRTSYKRKKRKTEMPTSNEHGFDKNVKPMS